LPSALDSFCIGLMFMHICISWSSISISLFCSSSWHPVPCCHCLSSLYAGRPAGIHNLCGIAGWPVLILRVRVYTVACLNIRMSLGLLWDAPSGDPGVQRILQEHSLKLQSVTIINGAVGDKLFPGASKDINQFLSPERGSSLCSLRTILHLLLPLPPHSLHVPSLPDRDLAPKASTQQVLDVFPVGVSTQ
jgi:hypothetical protein